MNCNNWRCAKTPPLMHSTQGRVKSGCNSGYWWLQSGFKLLEGKGAADRSIWGGIECHPRTGGGGGRRNTARHVVDNLNVEGEWAAKTVKRPPQQPTHTPSAPTTGPRKHGNNTTRNTGRSGCQNAATQSNMRRKERVTVQGPVKKPQLDEMSHRGAAGVHPLQAQACLYHSPPVPIPSPTESTPPSPVPLLRAPTHVPRGQGSKPKTSP